MPQKPRTSRVAGLRIDAGQLAADLAAFAELVVETDGGMARPTLSAAEIEARTLFMTLAEAAGCRIQIDPWGNIFATRGGRRSDASHLLIGGHLDAGAEAPGHEGTLGLMAGLAVLRAMTGARIKTRHALTLVSWSNSTGARFAPGLTGAAGFAGQLPPEAMETTQTADGLSYAQELNRTAQNGLHPFVAAVAGYCELRAGAGNGPWAADLLAQITRATVLIAGENGESPAEAAARLAAAVLRHDAG